MNREFKQIITRLRELISPPGAHVQPWLPVDAPVRNSPSDRRPGRYLAVIDQFEVGKNPRYKQDQQGKGETYCNIFIWDVTRAMGVEIPHWVDKKNHPAAIGGGRELDANGAIEWLQSQESWKKVDSEQAQELANQGFPVVAARLNPDGIGHIAIVRPGNYSSSKGPGIAQAGENNFNHGNIAQGFKAAPDIQEIEYFFRE